MFKIGGKNYLHVYYFVHIYIDIDACLRTDIVPVLSIKGVQTCSNFDFSPYNPYHTLKSKRTIFVLTCFKF